MGANIKRLLCWYTLLIVVGTSAPLMAGGGKVPNILVLHSYHQGLQWTDNITRGIEFGLSDMRGKMEIHFEYLDTKRNPGEAYFKRLIQFERYKTKLAAIEFAVIICSDNNALRFIVDHGDQLYPGVPVVFCGVNNFSKEMLKGKSRITGVVEQIDYAANLDLMRRLHPERNRILVVLDKTPTGRAIKKEFATVADSFREKLSFKYFQDFVLADVPRRISELGDRDLIYMLTFNRDRLGNFISYVDGIRMIHSAAKVPIYGSWDFYFGNGIVGGSITSGIAQGQEAARLAREILAGKQASTLPIVTSSPNRLMFDYLQMARFGIKSSQLPPDSRLINQPPDLFERFRAQIIFLLCTITGMTLLLLWGLWGQRRNQLALEKNNLELDRRVAEQTAELRRKNELLQREIAERKLLEKEIRELAFTDPLTGIRNRRSFMEQADKEWKRSRRYVRHLSLLMADIDHFKNINDTYGHPVGDLALKVFAKTCAAALRDNDILGRMGGEEFAVILVETGETQAFEIADRLRQKVAAIAVKEGNFSFNMRVSIGVATIRQDDGGLDDLLLRADKGLYKAKRGGRNRVVSEG